MFPTRSRYSGLLTEPKQPRPVNQKKIELQHKIAEAAALLNQRLDELDKRRKWSLTRKAFPKDGDSNE